MIKKMKCAQCQSSFEWSEDNQILLDKISPVINGKKHPIPNPALCFICCLKRRLSFRNQFSFYKRKSNLSEKPIISIYSPDKSESVYEHSEWWSDQWSPLDYGRELDFNRPFFDQFNDLFKEVPKINLIQSGTSENSQYTNFGGNNKNCYITVSLACEDTYYTYGFFSKNCVDCFGVKKCEKCYECIDCTNCYSGFYLQNCAQCSESWFLESCTNCKNCIGCKNLKNKEYHIFNKPYSRDEYHQLKESYSLNTKSGIEKFKKEFNVFKNTLPFRFAESRMSENSTGNFLDEAKNCHCCFDVVASAQDCRESAIIGMKAHDLLRCTNTEGSLSYEADALLNSQAIFFSHMIRNCSDVFYSMFCYNSQHLFGCVGLNQKKYCILNKQYTKEEYEKLVPQIIKHMKSTSEWGEFFPPSISPFGYNETMAYEYFPMKKEEAETLNYKWSSYKPPSPKVEKVIPANKLPENTKDIPDDILNWAIICEETGKPFKITSQELKFYREHHLPIPRKSFYIRHLNRLKNRNSYYLWKRNCERCQKQIKTTYSPDRPEKVYCESCYLKEVY